MKEEEALLFLERRLEADQCSHGWQLEEGGNYEQIWKPVEEGRLY